MADQRIPNDPYRQTIAGGDLRGDDLRNPARLDNELQPDPELAEGPASGSRVAIYAVAIALVLGAVFYGLNNSSLQQAGTSSTAQTAPATSTAQNNSQPPPAPAGMRDVTPRGNTAAGVTTGAAPAHPQTPPSSAPTGQDASKASTPPTNTTK